MSEETTPRLGLPMIIGGQAQKHLTLNESLSRIDALLQARVISRNLGSPPLTPDEGDCYIVPPGGGWGGFSAGDLVRFDNTLWEGVTAPEGMIAFVSDEGCIVVRHEGTWVSLSETFTALDDLGCLGVGASADPYNVFTVKGPGAWMSAMESVYGGSGNFHLKLNKDSAGHSAEMVFQQGWSSRAVMGLRGDNDFSVSVSTDGTTYTEALRLKGNGRAMIMPQDRPGLDNSTHAANTRFVQKALTYRRANVDQRRFVTSRGWLYSPSPADNEWWSVCWSPELGLFVAVARVGSASRVMTSPDGVTWTLRVPAAENDWFGVCWSPELGRFVAVAGSGTGNRVMTSTDGINWTARLSASDNYWRDVCWSAELGLFVAVAGSGVGDRVMTSPDGITWTSRTTAAVSNDWRSVCWSPEQGLFVAVALNGTSNGVMTSPDGVNWTLRTSASDNQWRDVCWSPERGLFVAVAGSGAGDRVMTSPDGITWTSRASAADNEWWGVCWAPKLGLFTAVASTGTGNRVMTSPDGITWTARISAADIQWRAVCWSGELGLFVAVSSSGTGNRVMTSVQATGARHGRLRAGIAGLATISSDAAITLTPLVTPFDVRHTGTLTADRLITLSTLNGFEGARFRITRTGGGAFNLSIGGLKNLTTGTWCEVIYGGGSWLLSQYGNL